MRCAILDTNVYIGHWEKGLYAKELEAVRKAYVVRQSSIVLSELRRGARTPAAIRLVGSLARLSKVEWAPVSGDWWEAGRLIREIGDAEGWETVKRQAFQNDALIALTARRYGATIVTANRGDFERLVAALHIGALWV